MVIMTSPMQRVKELQQKMLFCSDNILDEISELQIEPLEACYNCEDRLRSECRGVCESAKLGSTCTNECWKSWKYGRFSCRSNLK